MEFDLQEAYYLVKMRETKINGEKFFLAQAAAFLSVWFLPLVHVSGSQTCLRVRNPWGTLIITTTAIIINDK